MDEHAIDAELTRDEALAALAAASEAWGAQWRRQGAGGYLELPVLAGLRRGVLRGRVSVEPAAAGSRILFRIDESDYRVHRTALGILLLGAAGGITATLWPFYPPLLGVAPLAVVLALGAWILVASRLRTSTAEDFLELVAANPPAEPADRHGLELARPEPPPTRPE
jgi:hypothetical protein